MTKALSVVLLVVVIIKFIIDLDTYIFLFYNGWGINFLYILVPAIVLPIGAYLFNKEKKTGWFLIVIYFFYALCVLCGFLMIEQPSFHFQSLCYFLIPYESTLARGVGVIVSSIIIICLFVRPVRNDFQIKFGK